MALSGQITIAVAGTAQQGPATPPAAAFAIKAHPDNADTVWVGGDGTDVTSSDGFPLDPGEGIVLHGALLDRYWFDAEVNGDKFCWIAL